MLQQPIDNLFTRPRRVLAIGAGGGWDIVSALGIPLALQDAGHHVALANVTFTFMDALERATKLSPNVYAVDHIARTILAYAPEVTLAKWFAARGDARPVHLLRKSGARPLRAAIQLLIERERPDVLLLLDGGIDALLRGDELSLGTPVEDWVSVAAAQGCTGVEHKLLACIGFGAERWDGIAHAQPLRRIAELSATGGFLGSESLLAASPPGRRSLDCLAYFEDQSGAISSIVASTIRAAMCGKFGLGPVNQRTATTPIFVSPLAAMAWFFDLEAVARRKLFLDAVASTDTVEKATMALEENRPSRVEGERLEFDCSR